MAFVKIDQLLDINIPDAIPVGKHEGFIAHVRLDPFHATAGHRFQTGIHQGDLPGFSLLVMDDLLTVVGKVKGDITMMQKIMGEIFLDHITLIPQADDELIDAIVRIDLHDVPEDRLAADLYHGLGLEMGLLADPGTETAGKNYSFHSYHQLLLTADYADGRRLFSRAKMLRREEFSLTRISGTLLNSLTFIYSLEVISIN